MYIADDFYREQLGLEEERKERETGPCEAAVYEPDEAIVDHLNLRFQF